MAWCSDLVMWSRARRNNHFLPQKNAENTKDLTQRRKEAEDAKNTKYSTMDLRMLRAECILSIAPPKLTIFKAALAFRARL
jgi:hypothetical protein